MDWIEQLAPMIGTALGGPLGGAAASFLADKLGIQTKSVEAVTNVLNSGKMTPDQIAAVQLAEIDFQKFLKQNEIDIAKLDVDNSISARHLQEITQSRVPGILAAIVVVGFFGILTSMMLDILDVSDKQALLLLLGSLSTAFGSVLNFYFGSSAGSAQKSVLLAASSPPSVK